MFLSQWLELLGRLCGNNVVMPVKIERAISVAVFSQQTSWIFLRGFCFGFRLEPFAMEPGPANVLFESFCSSLIIFAGRIFRRNGYEVRQQTRHLDFALLNPL